MKAPLATPADLAGLKFNDVGLIPVVAQDAATGAVLMLAWANADALEQSLTTGRMTYWSRSRNEIWEKGATSGHTQALVSLAADCDMDAVLATVEQTGAACHEGTGSCWGSTIDIPAATALGAIDAMAQHRLETPQGRYTDSLLADADLVAGKIQEEAEEVASVLRGLDNDDTLEHEAADLLYHLAVSLRGSGSSLAAALRELHQR